MPRFIWGAVFVTLAACAPQPVQVGALGAIFAYAVWRIVRRVNLRDDLRHAQRPLDDP